MKILMLCRLYNPHVGGVERHVAELAAELKKRKHQITIITEQYDPLLPLNQTMAGVRVLRLPHSALQSKRAVWDWVKSQRNIFEKADLIHIHDVFWWYLPLRFGLKKQPVYITFHGYEGYKPPRWQAVIQRKMAEKLCWGSICIGGFMKRWYRANPDKVLYGAANCLPARSSKSRSAVFLGRLDEDTGIMTYLKAVNLIKPEIALDIYGEGPQAKQALNFIKTRKLPAANHGAISDGYKMLKNSRWAFVSRYLAILEAMQSKRLVVAVYNNKIKKDYLICHPQVKNMLVAGTPQELVNKLTALTPETEKQMIDEAYNWAKEQTWEHLTDEYEDLWKK